MPVPSYRVPVKIARGTYANLSANLAELQEGEIVYANDENALYVVEGGVLTKSSADLGISSIGDLGDVDTSTAPPTDGQALVWDNTNSEWIPGTVATATPDLDAVTTAGATTSNDISVGDLLTVQGDGASQDGRLKLNCSANTHAVTIQSPPHSDAATYSLILPSSAGTAGQVLTSQGGAQLTWETPSLVGSIDDLTDVDTTTTPPTTDQVLAWDGTEWAPNDVSAVGGGVTRIQDATDYEPNTTPPAGTIYYFPKAIANKSEDWTCPDEGTYSTDTGDGTFRYVARYDRDGQDTQGVFPSSGSIWWTFDLTQPWTQMTYTAIGASSICSANSRKAYNNTVNGWPLDGSTDKTLYIALSDLGSGTPVPLAAGDYLRYDGGDFRPQQLATVAETGAYSDLSGRPTLVTSIDDLTDVDTSTAAPTDGQVLTWDNVNSAWEPATPVVTSAATARTLLGIGEYADDAAAGTGGVASGALYYNTTSSDYRLKT